MRALSTVTITTLLGLLPGAAQAELMIGGFPPSGVTSQPLSQFATDAQGTAAPIRQIAGAATQLQTPSFGVYEPLEKVIYVSDFFGQATRVYPAFASGDVAPLRVLNPPILGQTRASAPVTAHNELLVIGNNCCIYTFPLLAQGSEAQVLRAITWGGLNGSVTQLDNPGALTYFPNSDEVAVLDYDSNPSAGKVVFHARTANGNAAPTRVLKSSYTFRIAGIAHDPAQDRLYVLTSTTMDDLAYVGHVHVFAAGAAGATPPLYSIEGPATHLDFSNATGTQYFTGIAVDTARQRLMVGIGANGNPAVNRVIVFSQAASGNAVPLQTLSGLALSAGTIGMPFAVPTERVFANGFDN